MLTTLNKKNSYIIVVILLALLALQSFMSMKQKSATSDETPHLSAGYSYLKTGSFKLNPEHPPLVKLLSAVPLMFLNLNFPDNHSSWKKAEEWQFGEQFLYNNKLSAERIVFLGRIPVVILSIILGFIVFRWAKELYGIKSGLFALFLYVFSPNILAHSRFVTMDLGISLFTMLSLYAFYRFLSYPKTRNLIVAGILLGLALSTKFSAINILPMYVILCLILVLKKKNKIGLPRLLLSLCLMVVMGIFVTFLVYGFSSMHYYFNGLKFISGIVGKSGMSTFLFGKHSTQGWRYYFIAAFLIKTPVPTIIFILMSAVYFIKKPQIKIPEYFILVPIALLLAVSSISRMQLGLRYILPVYPFIFIWISNVINKRFISKNIDKYLIIFLLFWYLGSALKTFPHYLSYFNEFIGGPKNGYKYLIDSNVDWGQDLPGLRDYLNKEGNPEIILSFFGSAAPLSYGIQYQDFYSYNASGRKEKHVNSLNPSKEYFVISANALQCLYFPDKQLFGWLKDTVPAKVIGHSIFIYDITGDELSHFKFGVMYSNGGKLRKAEREFRRVLKINPAHQQAKQYLNYITEKRKSG